MTSLALQSAAPSDHPVGTYSSKDSYEIAMRQATALAASTLVPVAYQGNPANCFMALELATRVGASAMMVMQNVHIIEGKPGWSSQFVIAAINASKRFSPLRFRYKELGEVTMDVEEWYGPRESRSKRMTQVTVTAMSCVAFARSREDGEMVTGPTVTTAMAMAEGWYSKKGSKWKTMPEVMFMYRSAALFGRFYAPDILMGMQTADEIEDVQGADQKWEPDPMAEAMPTPAPAQQADVPEILLSPLWTEKQRAALLKRYSAADTEGRVLLVAAATAQIAPAPAEVQTAEVQTAEVEMPQDDTDLVENDQ